MILRGNVKATITANVSQTITALGNAYKSHADTELAKKMKKHMRGLFEYYGKVIRYQ